MSFFRKLGGSLLRKLKSGDLPVFLLFLLVTSFFWMSQKMSDDYQTQIQYEVDVAGLDNGLRITEPLSSPIVVTVHGTGSALWKEKRKNRQLQIPASMFHTLRSGSRILPTAELKSLLAAELPMSLILDEISPDTISFSAGREVRKRLPVRLDGNVTNADRYIVDELILDPDSVTVGLVGMAVDTLQQIFTEKFTIEADDDTSEFQLNLVPAEGSFLTENMVSLRVIASQYTEKSLSVPVRGINFPKGTLFRPFPARVNVMFLVGLDKFDVVSEDDFVVAVDYEGLADNDEKVEPVIVLQPDYARNVRLRPRMIEYMLEKESDVK